MFFLDENKSSSLSGSSSGNFFVTVGGGTVVWTGWSSSSSIEGFGDSSITAGVGLRAPRGPKAFGTIFNFD
jgi:hypothetical protein